MGYRLASQKAKTKELHSNMKKQFTFPAQTPNTSKASGNRDLFKEAVSLGANMALSKLTPQLKQVFPNFDPTFFTPSFELSRSRNEAVIDPYTNNPWVYAAVNAIATNLIQLPKALDLKSTKEEKELVMEHPILDLLNNPNPLMDGPTFWENIILSLMLPTTKTKGGQCFIVSESGVDNPSNLHRGDIPMEL